MTSLRSWRLSKVILTDFLGFQGQQEFSFKPGIQVIQAPNHTGKTSLTLGILWAITSEIPKLERINKSSFRLYNRHKGESNAEPGVSIELVSNGDTLRIDRLYSSARSADPDKLLSVELAGEVLTGEAAQARIYEELNLKPGSIEGCSVVLQDHRLKLITGRASDVGDVINDMLQLHTLSELVPVLEDRQKAAMALATKVQAHLEVAAPLRRWEEKEGELAEAWQEAENKALSAGYTAEQVETPEQAARSELSDVAEGLKVEIDVSKGSIEDSVTQLRTELQRLRLSVPEARELNRLTEVCEALQRTHRDGEAIKKALQKHFEVLTAEAVKGEMDEDLLRQTLAAAEARLATNKKRSEKLTEEQVFLAKAYEYLLQHPEAEACPVCETPKDAVELTRRTKERVAGSIAQELEEISDQDKRATEQKRTSETRLAELRELKDAHDKHLGNLADILPRLPGNTQKLQEAVDADRLFVDPAARDALDRLLCDALMVLEKNSNAAEQTRQKQLDVRNRIEEETFQPAEDRITRVREHLYEVAKAQNMIEAHAQTKSLAESRQSELAALEKKARDLASRLKKIAKEVTAQEQQTAEAAIQGQLPRINEFFKTVAANPDYDGLQVKVSLKKDRVDYALRATSSRIGSLDDTVGHVLSEGDLSAAGMALLLGLATGSGRRTGFVVLDDPAQGMDEVLQGNFAKTLGNMAKDKQVVILTHQASFAEALKGAGADYTAWRGWKEGKLQHV